LEFDRDSNERVAALNKQLAGSMDAASEEAVSKVQQSNAGVDA